MKLPIQEGGLPLFSLSFSDGMRTTNAMRRFKNLLLVACLEARLVVLLGNLRPAAEDLAALTPVCEDYHLREPQDSPEKSIQEPRQRGTQQDRPEQLEYG